MALTRLVAATALALTACGGEANLGEDAAGEVWSNATPGAAPDTLAILYRGERSVQTFTVHEGTLYALLGTRDGEEPSFELIACSIDDCADQRRVLWRGRSWTDSFGSLVVEPPEIFWVDNADHEVVGCRIDDCEKGPRSLGSALWPMQIDADPDFVYWLDEQQRLVRCPHGGCGTRDASEPIDPNAIPSSGQVMEFVDSVYRSRDRSRKIARVDKAGAPEELLYESVLPLSSFDVSANGVYFATNVLTGEVIRCPLSGACGAGEVLASGQGWPTVVRVASGAVFWFSSSPENATVVKLDLGSRPREVAPRGGILGDTVVSDDNLYWSERDHRIDQIKRLSP